MKLTKTDWKNGEVKIEITTPEDLWVLNQIIEPGNSVSARTMRKLKIGDEGDRNITVVRKPVNLTVNVTKVQLTPERDSLRVSGTVTRGPEDVPLGSHHTISLEPGGSLLLVKKWLSYQKERLIEASKESKSRIVIAVHDREEAIIAETSPDGHRIVSHLRGQVAKKYAEQAPTNFYAEIVKYLSDYSKRRNPSHIIIASPAFWKDELKKNLTPELAKKTILATCSSVSENAISEVLNRQETKTALQEDRLAREMQAVEKLLTAMGSDKPSTYGPDHVAKAAQAGAIENLLLSDKLLSKYKEEENFKFLEEIMTETENSKGKILIVSSSNEAGKRLDGIGGIGAVLRYPLEF